ncbi:MAG: PEP-CTERM sorting domain-containing protein [Salinisphaera sp.]|uniref:PEP-CTERM sorting domain-containing protein n=1 Tax=Salinisphaera sp. TaxID=1914330 RepID=UPI003C7E02C9
MKRKYLWLAALATLLLLTSVQALATVAYLNFSGPGINGSLALTYGVATDATYGNAYEVTGISGTFSDSNNGLNIANENVTSLVPINHATPEPTNLLAPHDFSRFAVASGLPAQSNGYITYDNLFWPGGSPQTASDYPFGGGLLDIYGLLFNLGGGKVVGLWSDGVAAPGSSGSAYYGVAVATKDRALDYVSPGVSVPEPGSGLMLLTALGVLLVLGRRRLADLSTDA